MPYYLLPIIVSIVIISIVCYRVIEFRKIRLQLEKFCNIIDNVLQKNGVGVPWLVGTKALDFQVEVKRTLAFNSKEILKRYHAEAEFLYNFISEDNMFTIGWLDWLGFTIRRGWGIRNGVPFAYVFHEAEGSE